MKFERMEPPPHLAGCVGYAAFDFDMSFVISFDKLHPQLGWRASYRKDGGDIVHLPEVFKTKRAAVKALEIERKRFAQ